MNPTETTEYYVRASDRGVRKALAGPFRARVEAERAAVEYAHQGWSVEIETVESEPSS